MNANELAALLNKLTRYDIVETGRGYESYRDMEISEYGGEWVKLDELLSLLKLKMGEGENWNKIVNQTIPHLRVGKPRFSPSEGGLTASPKVFRVYGRYYIYRTYTLENVMRNSLRVATLCLLTCLVGCAGLEHKLCISYARNDVKIEVAASRNSVDYSVSVLDEHSANR